eukprot:3729148-Alexandrium_andersonii.AAC.1
MRKAGPVVFNHLMLGPEGPAGLANLWAHMADQDWANNCPCFPQDRQEWSHLAPFRVHGDAARAFK